MLMQKENKKSNSAKKIAVESIKVLFALLIYSTFFHSEISELLNRFSNFAFHHFFFTMFLILFILVVTIEYEFFQDQHWSKIIQSIENVFIKTNAKKTIQK